MFNINSAQKFDIDSRGNRAEAVMNLVELLRAEFEGQIKEDEDYMVGVGNEYMDVAKVECPNRVGFVTRYYTNSPKSGDKITKSGHSGAKVVKQPPQDEEKKMQEIKEEEDIPGGGEDLILSEEIPDVKREEIPAREDLNNLEEINETAKEGDLEHIGNILPSTDHVNIA